jgi:hypothetical protein
MKGARGLLRMAAGAKPSLHCKSLQIVADCADSVVLRAHTRPLRETAAVA